MSMSVGRPGTRVRGNAATSARRCCSSPMMPAPASRHGYAKHPAQEQHMGTAACMHAIYHNATTSEKGSRPVHVPFGSFSPPELVEL